MAESDSRRRRDSAQRSVPREIRGDSRAFAIFSTNFSPALLVKQKVLIAFARQRLRRGVNAKVLRRNFGSRFNVETRCVFQEIHEVKLN